MHPHYVEGLRETGWYTDPDKPQWCKKCRKFVMKLYTQAQYKRWLKESLCDGCQKEIKIEPVYWRVHSDTKCVGWRAIKNGKVICRRPTKQEILDFLKEKGGV